MLWHSDVWSGNGKDWEQDEGEKACGNKEEQKVSIKGDENRRVEVSSVRFETENCKNWFLTKAQENKSSLRLEKKFLDLVLCSNNTGPVISCNDSGNKYEVVLSRAEGDEKDLGLGITLKVWITWQRSGNKVERKWGRRAVGEHDWFDFGLSVEGNKLKAIMYRDSERQGFNWNSQVGSCESKNLKFSKDYDPQDGTGKVTDVFKFVEDKCKSWFFTKTCDIKISSSEEGFVKRKNS